MNILEEFYYGNVNPNEKSFRWDSQYASFMKIVCDNEEKLNQCLEDEEKQLFTRLMNAQNEVLGIECREWFIEGWRLGAQFMLDTFLTQRCGSIKSYEE